MCVGEDFSLSVVIAVSRQPLFKILFCASVYVRLERNISPHCGRCLEEQTSQNSPQWQLCVLNKKVHTFCYTEDPGCCLNNAPVLRWRTAHQDQSNSSNPCSSRSGPVCSRCCTGWVPLLAVHSYSYSEPCYLWAGAACRAEGRPGYSSWRERNPAGNGHLHYSGYDWK